VRSRTGIHHPGARSFHTNVEVGKGVIDEYPGSSSFNEISRKHGNTVANMVSVLLTLGASHVFIEPYEVSVHFDKGPWNEEIDRVVERAFRELHNKATTKEMKIFIQTVDKTKTFDTNFIVAKTGLKKFERPLQADRELKDLGTEGESFVRMVMALPGVITIWIQSSEIQITIGEAFFWTDECPNGSTIEQNIEEIFEDVFDNVHFVDYQNR